jgi:hypothetical protein
VAQLVGDLVAQLVKGRLGEPDCNAAVPGSIPASSTVSCGAAGIMTVYQKSKSQNVRRPFLSKKKNN